MGVVGKVVGPVATAAGLVGAAVLGGMTAHRARQQHYREVERLAGWGRNDPFDEQQTDRSYSLVSTDGVALHVEEVGDPDAPITVILAHGWTLRLGAWHYQRAAAGQWAPDARLVLYDQRSHGRSSRAPRGSSRLTDLAGDLAAVMSTAAPTGPVVLVGHSMGGMAILSLAAARPDLFENRVRGVALISTSASEESRSVRRLGQLNGSNPVLPWIMSLAGRYPRVAERGRSINHDAVWLLTRSWGFADPEVPAALVDYVDGMIASVPIDVIADFAPALLRHDDTAALPVLRDLSVMIAVGADDKMTPVDRARAMADALPDADLVVVPGAGHLLPLERPGAVNMALARLMTAARSRTSS